jgi:hypothetical protein
MKLKRKEFGEEVAKLHVELVKLQEWVKHKGRQGRRDKVHHRTGQSPRLQSGSAAGAD